MSEPAPRRLSLLPCTPEQAQALMHSLLGQDVSRRNALWVDSEHTQAFSQATQCLGLEAHTVVFNAHSQGLEPNQLAAIAGCVLGGGRLVLLAPELSAWPHWQDAMSQRIQALGYHGQHSFYRQRLVRLLQASEAVEQTTAQALIDTLTQAPALASTHPHKSPLSLATAPSVQPSFQPSNEQRQRVEQLRHNQAHGRLSCLTAERGRGKSTTLALSLLSLAQQQSNTQKAQPILLSAPSKRALSPLLRQLSALLNCEAQLEAIKQHSGLHLLFYPPDQLLSHLSSARWVLIDEASGVDIHLLERIQQQARACCFCGTIAAYEGTANAFFIQGQRLWPEAQWLTLDTPFRFARNDPLEQLMKRCCMPSPRQHQPKQLANGHRHLSAQTLAHNDHLLSEVYQLLIDAHYDTKPNDLRHLLDGGNVSVHAWYQHGQLSACALVAKEGRLPHALHQPIWRGQRRPRGHLLPQVMAYQQGFIEALGLSYWRVVRIAVLPAQQQRGIGSRLLDALVQGAREQGADFIGASFGARTPLARFWLRHGFLPLHWGVSQNASSGCYALSVLKPLKPFHVPEAPTSDQHTTPAPTHPLSLIEWQAWQHWFSAQFQVFKRLLSPLDADSLFALIDSVLTEDFAPNPVLSAEEIESRIARFLASEAGVEQSAAALLASGLDEVDTPLTTQRVKHALSWQTLRDQTGQGKRALEQRMRHEIKTQRERSKKTKDDKNVEKSGLVKDDRGL